MYDVILFNDIHINTETSSEYDIYHLGLTATSCNTLSFSRFCSKIAMYSRRVPLWKGAIPAHVKTPAPAHSGAGLNPRDHGTFPEDDGRTALARVSPSPAPALSEEGPWGTARLYAGVLDKNFSPFCFRLCLTFVLLLKTPCFQMLSGGIETHQL